MSVYSPLLCSEVKLGIDRLFSSDYEAFLKGKRIGLVTNHTGINSKGELTSDLIKKQAKAYSYSVVAFFSPEHGLFGSHYMENQIADNKDSDGIPIYSLYGEVRRPTAAMLKNISLLIFDIQDLGTRSYTYSTTLFYVMEEAAKAKIPVLVVDRPNPLGGLLVDGPMLEDKWRSFIGYINVPYCHGLTIGELAQYFNGVYQVGCDLTVVPMSGWKRYMTFQDTGLMWIPTSPHIPTVDTAFFYPMTGLLGELQIVSIGVGYTLPFKVIGAPWIDAKQLAHELNRQNFPGVYFHPFHFRPFFGRFAGEECHGVLIHIRNPQIYLPVATQYLIIGTLKSLYPQDFKKALKASSHREEMFNKANGTAKIYQIIKEDSWIIWKLRAFQKEERLNYLNNRRPYLISQYEN